MLISDGMVLQRDAEVKIWGHSPPLQSVEMHFLDSVYHTRSGFSGYWQFILSGLEAGGPHRMQIVSGGDTANVRDILIGEVWVCSGQSQMDMDMNRVRPLYEEEIAQAGNPMLRYFEVPAAWNFRKPQKDLPGGKWESISQDNILRISAIACFFADELYKQYGIPVGMIRASLGGSPAEAWMSADALKKFPEHLNEAYRYRDEDLIARIQEDDKRRIQAWHDTLNRKDRGYQDTPWYRPETDVSDWPFMPVPGYWADQEPGEINGSVWFRKDIDLPRALKGKPARLNLGRMVDADSVFVNGVFVGSVSYQYPPRRYHIPEGILKAGTNSIVVRVISQAGKGGFVPDKPYELIVDQDTIDLTGTWQYRIGAVMPPLAPQTFIRWKPTGLFNAMIAPLTRYTIRGVIWYQGESNAERPQEYARLFPALINNWREKWGQGDFPFLFVQLHNFMESHEYPTESNWALTREAQMRALSLPNTAMAVAIDLGEWNDIHPLNKKDVAERLILAARKTAYGEENVVASGPMYQSMEIQGDSIVLSFSETGSGLVAQGGGELKHFAIAGKDRKFVWAGARIDGNRVVVWNKHVKNPVAVRYAWADNPEGANLYNREGLPAAPFRTDDW